MKYKARYKPSDLLCPVNQSSKQAGGGGDCAVLITLNDKESREWKTVDQCLPILDKAAEQLSGSSTTVSLSLGGGGGFIDKTAAAPSLPTTPLAILRPSDITAADLGQCIVVSGNKLMEYKV